METLDELIARAKAKRQQDVDIEKVRIADLDKDEARKIANLIEKASSLLPEAVWEFVQFEAWHTPNYEYRELWNATVLVAVPDAAPVRVYLMVSSAEKVTFYGLGNYGPSFAVLTYRVDEFEGEYYARADEHSRLHVSRKDTFEDALGIALELGDTRKKSEEEIMWRTAKAEIEAESRKAPKPELYCPVMGTVDRYAACERDQCAWWISYRGASQCAIAALGNQAVSGWSE